jgi:hypothetical protein
VDTLNIERPLEGGRYIFKKHFKRSESKKIFELTLVEMIVQIEIRVR